MRDPWKVDDYWHGCALEPYEEAQDDRLAFLRIYRLILTLPRRWQRIFALHYCSRGYTDAHIARSMRVTPERIRQILYNAHMKIWSALFHGLDRVPEKGYLGMSHPWPDRETILRRKVIRSDRGLLTASLKPKTAVRK